MPRRASTRFAPEDVARMRLPSAPQISPDGRRIVYVETVASLEHDRNHQTLVCIDVETGRSTPLAPGLHADRSPTWTPDSKSVVFVSDREGGSGLWRIRPGDRAPAKLAVFQGQARQPRVSPDGRFVAFLFQRAASGGGEAAAGTRKRSPGPRVRHLTRLEFGRNGDGSGDAARHWTHLWLLALANGKLRQLTSGEFDDGPFDWSPNSRALVFVSNRVRDADVHRGTSDLFVVPARGGRARALTRERGPKSSPRWSPDGRTIAWIGHLQGPARGANVHLWTVPVGRGPARDLVGRADLLCDARLVSDSGAPAGGPPPEPHWSPDSRRITFLATRDGATNVWEAPVAGGAPRQVSFGAHEIRSLSQSRDGRRWAFVRATPTSPGEIAAADWPARRPPAARGLMPGAQVRPLTRLGATFAARALAPEELRIPCRDGHEIQAWVLRAGGARAKPGPAVLMLPGDSQTAYGATWIFEFQLLAARGIHVFYANLRGSAGYGQDFMRSLVGKWGHFDQDDLMRVAEAIEALPFVDRTRIAVAGAGYGGYLTAWAIAHTQRFKCAIAMRGAYDLVSMHGTGDLGWDLVHEFEDQRPWESIDRWWRVSPLAHVKAMRTPLLLMHSDNDTRFPVSQSQELFTALRVLERDVELVRFAGEGHDLPRSGHPQNRVERLRCIAEWLDRKL